MKHIGYLTWNAKLDPNRYDEEFSKTALLDGDREVGYVEQKVYIDESETPE
jgi:hypothetical protein